MLKKLINYHLLLFGLSNLTIFKWLFYHINQFDRNLKRLTTVKIDWQWHSGRIMQFRNSQCRCQNKLVTITFGFFQYIWLKKKMPRKSLKNEKNLCVPVLPSALPCLFTLNVNAKEKRLTRLFLFCVKIMRCLNRLVSQNRSAAGWRSKNTDFTNGGKIQMKNFIRKGSDSFLIKVCICYLE